jgi:hypothetical protein
MPTWRILRGAEPMAYLPSGATSPASMCRGCSPREGAAGRNQGSRAETVVLLPASSAMITAAFSPIMIVGAWVQAFRANGMIEIRPKPSATSVFRSSITWNPAPPAAARNALQIGKSSCDGFTLIGPLSPCRLLAPRAFASAFLT